MKKIFFILLFFCGLNYAQNNLEYFINSAIKNSPVIKEYENNRLITSLDKDLFNAENVLPKISLTANYQYFPYFNNSGKYVTTNPGPDAIGYDIGITNGGFYSAQLNFEKNLFNGGLINALEEQNNISGKAQANNILFEEHSLKKQVIDQYLATLQSQMNYSLANETLINISDQLMFTKNLVEKGLAKQSDYLLLQIEEGNQKIECGKAGVELKNNLYLLYSMCGIKDTQTVNLETVSLLKEQTASGSAFFSKYQIDSMALSAQQNIYDSKYLPQLKVFFNTGLNAVELEGIQKKFGMSAGIDFALPIYDGGQKDITFQQNIINQKTIGNYKNYFSVELQSRRRNSEEQLKSIEQNLVQIREQVKSYNTILEMKKKELEHGQISMIEYLTILKNFIELKKNKINTEIGYQTQINNYNYWNW